MLDFYSKQLLMGGKTGGGSGGSDTFEAQLALENVVFSGVQKTEEQIVNEAISILEKI